jgi:histone H3/H4
MIHKSKISELIRKNGKKPSREVLEKIEGIVSRKVEDIILRAKRKADFAGRKIILSEDVE